MSDNTNITKKHMSVKEILAYSLGLFGFQAIVGLLNSYQAEFYGSIMGASLAVVGIIILVAKIVSAIFDPIIGNKIEATNGKMGKFKPFILVSIPILLVFTAIIFLDIEKLHFANAGNALYVYIFVTFLIWCLGMTLADVPTQGIAAVLTRCGCAVTVEDHNIYGGLGDAVSEVACRLNPCRVLRVGLQDKYPRSGKAAELLDAYGLSVADIASAAKQAAAK